MNSRAGFSRRISPFSEGLDMSSSSKIRWDQVFKKPARGRYISGYAFALLLPVAGQALGVFAGQPPNQAKQLDAVLDSVFRFCWNKCPEMASYGAEPDKIEACGEVAIAMARQLGWTKTEAKAAIARMILAWWPQNTRGV